MCDLESFVVCSCHCSSDHAACCRISVVTTSPKPSASYLDKRSPCVRAKVANMLTGSFTPSLANSASVVSPVKCRGDTANARICVATKPLNVTAPEAVTPTLGRAYRIADQTHAHHILSRPGSDRRFLLRRNGFNRV